MLKIILALIVLIVVGVLVAAAMKPTDFRIVRTAKIAAPPSLVFDQVNDFHKWQAWSPWAKMDPNAENAFEGAAAGSGAIFSWDGNGKVGSGRMTIIESRPGELVRMKLEFFRPMKAVNEAEFTFKPEGAQTLMSWDMSGKSNYVSKVFRVFMDMDKMVGGQFEQGMANLNAVVQPAAAVR